jgi:hypothetical protein
VRGASALALAVGVFATGCGGLGGSGGGGDATTVTRTSGLKTFPAPGRLDETAGTYRGVGIGSTVDEMKRVFGEQRAAGGEERIVPLATGDGETDGPRVLVFEDDRFGPVFRYEHVVFYVNGPTIGAFELVEPGSLTGQGVKIGDPLDRAADAYPGVACGEENEGTENRSYPACTGSLAPERFIWFGGDPITTIAMSRDAFDGF